MAALGLRYGYTGHLDMENVGIRELKDNLSKYLMRVKGRRTLSVTERGRHIADIVPEKTALPAGISEMLSTASASWPEAERKLCGCKILPLSAESGPWPP